MLIKLEYNSKVFKIYFFCVCS